MSTRDDFSEPTKKTIAARAGYRCCYLGCGIATIGPNDESSTSVSSIGMACHISAAAPGKNSKRYDPSLTPEERAHADNGLWACYTHGKLIDTDEERFSTAILQKWKAIGEGVARIMAEVKCDYKDALHLFEFYHLAEEKIVLKELGNENETIGIALKDCGVEVSWGSFEEGLVRDYLIELTRNAFLHAKASNVEMRIEPDKIILIDDGEKFNPKDLLKATTATGGIISVKAISKNQNRIAASYKREGNKNYNTVIKVKDKASITDLTPCNIQISSKDFRSDIIDFKIIEACDDIFVLLPLFIAPSDLRHILILKENLKNLNKSVTLVYKDISEHIISILNSNNPEWSLLKL